MANLRDITLEQWSNLLFAQPEDRPLWETDPDWYWGQVIEPATALKYTTQIFKMSDTVNTLH
jgi:hypothetical protein